MKKKYSLPVSTAARLLGKSNENVYSALQQKAVGWGYATQMKSGEWSYHISPNKFYEYLGIEPPEEENE